MKIKKILKAMFLMSVMFTIATVGFGSIFAQAATYSPSDVAAHNTSSDCWVIVNNKVYNLTSFIGSHSGGASAITTQCGKNGTSSFTNGPHSASTMNAISSSLIGTIANANTPTPKPKTVTPVIIPDPSLILTSVVITPSTPSIDIKGKLQIVVTPKDQNGEALTGVTTTFASSNHKVALVNNTTGLVKGKSVGNTIITTTSILGDKVITSYTKVTVTSKEVIVEPVVIDDSIDQSDENDEGVEDESEHISKEVGEENNGQKFKNFENHRNDNRNEQEENDD